MIHCAPDIPFFETVLWYAKQYGAILLLVSFALLIALLVPWVKTSISRSRNE